MKNNYTLYLLLLSSKEAFKVGISSLNNFERICFLSKVYSFDFKNSYTITGKDEIIKLLERQLLVDYSTYKYSFLDRKDGYTEFLKIDCLEKVLEDIEFKRRLNHLSLNINKGIIINRIKHLPKEEIKKKTLLSEKIKKDMLRLNDLLDFMKSNKNCFFYKMKNEASNKIYLRVNNLNGLSFMNFTRELSEIAFNNSRWMIKASFCKTKKEGTIILQETNYLFKNGELNDAQKKTIDEALDFLMKKQ